MSLTFDVSEFVVLEDSIDVDETIQRPEEVRFFTVEEQETDAVELLLPKGRVTQFQRDEVADIVRRMRELYDEHVLILPDDYALREPERGTNLPWVHPVYADVELQLYDVATKWMPLFSDDAKRAPGFYPRMIAALPRPYRTTGGVHLDVSSPTEFVNAGGEKRLRVLPPFVSTQRIEHEDRSVDIVPHPMSGSGDVVNQLGYFLDKRPLEIPNPLPDHPFLAANASLFLETTAPLKDVLPSLDAVLTHAVPVTNDPYGQGTSYLKLYDINLSSIPWSSWKSRFPPVEVEQAIRERVEIPFPAPGGEAPSETILKAYKTTYAPGLSVREWLMRQDDGGEFIVRALLSVSSENGVVETIPGVDIQLARAPETTLDECRLAGLSFPEFLVRGVLRQEGTKFVCAPLEFVRQERARAGYLNRKPWGGETRDAITREHLLALRDARRREPEIPVLAEQRTPGKPESVHRQEVIAVLNDPRRHSRDKLRDLKDIVQDDLLTENIYRDADEQFVLCAHTLAILSGDLETDRLFFYDTWTVVSDGWRVCKVCGERLTGVDFVDQEEYDDEGFVSNRKEALEVPEVFVPDAFIAYGKGLKDLEGQFTLQDPCHAMVYEFLSLFRVLPKPETVKFFLDQSHFLKGKSSVASTDAGLEFRGLAGIATALLLVQCHIPLLEPRRSFWSKPTTFAGYPRDPGSPTDFGVLDILLMALENTYRGFPRAISGTHRQAVRAVLTDVKKTRTTVLALVGKLLEKPDIQTALQAARVLVTQLPPPAATVPFLPIRPPALQDPGYPTCPGGQSILAGKRRPETRQPDLPLRRGLQAGVREPVRSVPSERVEVSTTPADQVRRRLGLKAPALAKEAPRINFLIASRLASLQRRPLPIADVDPTQSPALLKSIAKGFVNEAAQGFKGDPGKDATLFCLLADYDKSRSEARRIRTSERLDYTDRMNKLSDLEREVNKELAERGMAPTIIKLAERAERGRVELSDLGVGRPYDTEEQSDIAYANAGYGEDAGDYGHLQALPNADGRDPFEATVWDDAETSV